MSFQMEELVRGLHTIKWVRFQWCCLANVLRGKSVYRKHPEADDYLIHGIGNTTACMAFPAWCAMLAPESPVGSPVGEVRAIPDVSTYRVLPFAPTKASCMANFYTVNPDGTKKPWGHCPRYFLKRSVDALVAAGYTIRCSFENEFCLFKKENGNFVGDIGSWCDILSENRYHKLIDDITDALVIQGIIPELVHKEGGSGQIEMVTRHDQPFTTADNQLVFRETVHAISQKYDYGVSFLPKVFEGIGSGLHMHVSLWKDGKNITAAKNPGEMLSEEAGHFVAGILSHLPALVAITTPTPNSYRRILPSHWAGAFNIWGRDNKEGAVRVSTSPSGGGSSHWEIKTVDATSNPYLAIGAVIAAGLDGLKNKMPLPKPCQVDPASLNEQQRTEAGISRLPESVEEALQKLQQDKVLLDALGPDLSASFIALRKYEAELLKNKSLAEERELLFSVY